MAAVARTASRMASYAAASLADGLGPELVLNGGFDADADWTKGTGWAIGSGVATKTAGTGANLSQTIQLQDGSRVQAQFTVTSLSAGPFRANLQGGTVFIGTLRSTIGRHTESIVVRANTGIAINAQATSAGAVDHASVRRIR